LIRFDRVVTLLLAFAAAAAPACSGRNQIGIQLDGGGAGGSNAGNSGTGGRGGAAGAGGQSSVAGSSGGAVGGTGGSSGVAGGAGGGAAGMGVAGSGTAGGGAAGTGVTPSGPQPRVLVVDPATNRFVAYDRQGQVVHNYHDRLDLGAGFAGRNVWVDGRLSSWDGPTDARAGSLVVAGPNGFAEPLQPSRILIRGQSSTTGPTRVRVLGADGAIINEHTIAGAWEAVHLSPKRGYIYANRYVDTPPTHDVGAVIRAADGMILAQRDVTSAAFARDDSRFVYVPQPYDLTRPVRVLDPMAGAEVGPAPGTEPWVSVPNMPQTFLQATVNSRAVLLVSGQAPDGRLLYSIDWLGNVLGFASLELPRYSDEYLLAFDPAGTKVMWSRQSINGGSSPVSGSFQLDFTNPPATPWTGGDATCFGRPTAVAFKLAGTSLQSCACSDGACTTIAAVPPVPDAGWLPRVLTNRSGSVVVVTNDWPLSRTPVSYPNTLCFSPTGQPLASAPYGSPIIDETGQLVLIRPSLGTQREHAIVDLTRGIVTLIGNPPGWSPVIIYE
jgi:hypothetical protein